MSDCRHDQLVLIRPPETRLRCVRCHLTITPAELEQGYCPECYETTGRQVDEFERLQNPTDARVRYRCERCGITIECGANAGQCGV